MKISCNWLSDYIDLSGISITDLAELLSTRVAEVDSVWDVGIPLRTAIAGRIVSTKFLNEKYLVATVDLKTSQKEIVCSASNQNPKQGMLVTYIPAGGKFFDGKAISVASDREFAGVKSSGLLASARDLELFDEHLGLYELKDISVGSTLENYLGGVDSIIEIDNKSLTHRPDLWSHFGFAQELAAVLKRPLKINLGRFSDDSVEGKISFEKLKSGKEEIKVQIEAATKVKRMVACKIDGVVDVQSPDWMKRRLFAIGAGVRSFLIDLSNYLMHDMGQPNHLFDRTSIKGDTIFIRSAKLAESIQTLDGTSINLTLEDAVIADSQHPLDLGGVMGGHDTSVSDSTRSIVFTSGTWDPVLVRKSSVRHQVRSDASQRYEKCLSPYLPAIALQRFLELLPVGCPEAHIVGAVTDRFPVTPEPIRITLSAKLLAERLGEGAPTFEEGCQILSNLRLKFIEKSQTSCTVEVPHDRATKDLSIPEDLIEEIGRTWGYENISEVAPKIATVPSTITPLRALEIKLKEILRGNGFNEISNYSFVKPEYSEKLGYGLEDGIFIENPVDETQGALRTSLIPGLLERVLENSKFQSSLQIFEVGRGYFKSPIEKYKDYKTLDRFKNLAAYEKRFIALGLLIDPTQAQTAMPKVGGGIEFYSLVEVVRKLCSVVCDSPLVVKPAQASTFAWMHPRRAAELQLDGRAIGVIAECNPSLTKEALGRVVLCELELDTLLEHVSSRKFTPISKYPTSLFEISIVAPIKEHFCSILDVIRLGIHESYLKSIELLDVYVGAPVASDKKSVSVRIAFGADDKTLSGEEISKLQEKLMENIERNNYGIRR